MEMVDLANLWESSLIHLIPLQYWVVVLKIFYVHPYLGKISHFDEHIFQRGGSTTN